MSNSRKAILALSALLAYCLPSQAAARFLVPNGISGACTGVWSDTKCWSLLTYTGNPATTTNGVAAPGASDDVTFDGNSGTNMTVNGGGGNSALTFTCTVGYTNTLAMSNSLTVSGTTLTLCANIVVTGSAALVTTGATMTITSNGLVWPAGWSFANGALTLADNLTISGLVQWTGAGTCSFTGAFTLSTSGGITISSNSPIISNAGTFVGIKMTAGTLTSNATANSIRTNFEVAGNVTWSGTVRYQTGTWTHTSGTITPGSSTFTLTGAATITANASGLVFNILSVISGNQIFNGTSGWTAATFSNLIAGISHTFTAGNTYTVTSALIVTATAASHSSFLSSSGGSAFTLNTTGANVALAYCNMTDIIGTIPIYVYNTGSIGTGTTNVSYGSVIGSGSGGGHIIGG